MAPKKKGGKKKDKEAPTRAFKGVYRSKGLHRARLWDVDREVYLGHFDDAETAGRAYDRAAISLKGLEAASRDGLNFHPNGYAAELDYLLTTEFREVVEALRESGTKPAQPVPEGGEKPKKKKKEGEEAEEAEPTEPPPN